MIADFEDCCRYTYMLVDDLWAHIGHRYRRPGPSPSGSDSELITMVLVGEYLHHPRRHLDLPLARPRFWCIRM